MSDHFLNWIEIKEFKCFKEFKASGFKRVNLIGGKNNIGKTAFMEACFINVHSVSVNTMMTVIRDIKFMRENINLLVKSPNDSISDIELLNTTKVYCTESNLRKLMIENKLKQLNG